VLTLRDVLAFSTAEVAAILGATPAAVDAALRRARSRLAEAAPVEDGLTEPGPDTARLLDRYVDAFTRADPGALVDLLRADVELEMPPVPTWFSGRPAVVGFLGRRVLRRAHQWRLTPDAANGAPAFVVHELREDGLHHAYGVQVLTLAGDRVARITAFNDPALVPTFGHPAVMAV
jgi:RNA polymerase sigma-70 factor (ECF subfamily)